MHDSLLDAGLGHVDWLEASLEGGVLLDVLAVLGDGRGSDALELASCQSRLEEVGRVDGALRGTRPHERMELVDEENSVRRLGDLINHLAKPRLELASILGVGNEQPQLEGEQPHLCE